ncbi:4Fe-4S single cluster domain-containing protein [Kitasatospora sp. NPDC059803]|uniref:4Fe-4S single cluster domain-containing protein n=1 Tax=Kitasatospora sp. NPDC059803 TaxID=3346953 RepID=UPI00365CD5B5
MGTRALGPGLRSVLWVQGCPFTCRGCMSPQWIPDRRARLVAPSELASELLHDSRVTGLTLSGGEPMEQADALAEMVAHARAERDLSVLCFTGYRLEQLHADPPNPGVARLLACVDTLVDGRYVAALDDGRGLRGSRNQRVHRLNPRAEEANEDFEESPRSVEIALEGPTALLVGVPPPGLLTAFDTAVDAVRARLRGNPGAANGARENLTERTGNDER